MQLKFITLNVWHGGKLFENTIEFLKNEQPDILAVQEAYNETDSRLEKRYRTVHEFKKLLRFPYATYSPAFLLEETDGLQIEQGNAVFSKFPLKLQDVTFYDHPYRLVHAENRSEWPTYPRLLQHVSIDLGVKRLDIFNTHGIWGEDGEDSPRRLAMSQTIIEQVKNKEHVILSGDFNVNEHTQSIKHISEVLHDVFKGELQTSFNMKQKPKDSGYGNAVVDHIFVSRDLHIMNHYLPDVDISDHMPLAAVIEI